MLSLKLISNFNVVSHCRTLVYEQCCGKGLSSTRYQCHTLGDMDALALSLNSICSTVQGRFGIVELIGIIECDDVKYKFSR